MADHMDVEDRPLLSSSVRERDIDSIVVQLVRTSPPFREWFRNQFPADGEREQFLGVSRSVENVHGESDIEIAFEASPGNRHLVLIEDKIDASFQDNQAERYFKRGEKYVENGVCDEYSVGLIAPDGYVDESARDSFDAVVSYEDIVARLESVSHEGSRFSRPSLIWLSKKKPKNTTRILISHGRSGAVFSTERGSFRRSPRPIRRITS